MRHRKVQLSVISINKITICNIERNSNRTITTTENPKGTHIIIDTISYDYLYNIKTNRATVIRNRVYSNVWEIIENTSKQKANDLKQLLCEYVT